jgi:sirohydrochlorin ferrochelatase
MLAMPASSPSNLEITSNSAQTVPIQFRSEWKDMGQLPDNIAVILVDHGSTVDAANAMLDDVVRVFRGATAARIVEPAHMELANPTIGQAFERCVALGARSIIVHPYFLSPGRHSTEDIPRMVREAAARHPRITFCVTEPLGVDVRMAHVIWRRIEEALKDLNVASHE